MHISVSFGATALKNCSSFSPLNFIKQKTWFEMFSRFFSKLNIQNFSFLHISVAKYIVISSFFEIDFEIWPKLQLPLKLVKQCLLVTGQRWHVVKGKSSYKFHIGKLN